MDSQMPLGTRALSDFVYCPRLFHLEHVEGFWSDTEETRLGRHVHAVTDVPSGPQTAAQRVNVRDWRVRSVRLWSDELAVTAVCDVIEAKNGTVFPIEYRRGTPSHDGSPWESDQIQVLVQIALLRHNGYRCNYGYLWYDQVRRRVPVAWSADREVEIRRYLFEARKVADAATPPPPLVHSNRCPKCALLQVCMPDEINELTERDDRPPRRLLARAPDRFPAYVTVPGATVGVRNEQLVATKDAEQLTSMKVRDVLHLVAAGPVQVTTQAIHALAEQDAPVVWTSTGGRLKAVATPSAGKHVELRRRQYTAESDRTLDLSRQIVFGKIRNCRTLLRRNVHSTDDDLVRQLDTMSRRAQRAPTRSTLLGIEGGTARLYFGGLAQTIRHDHQLPGPAFDATGRTRRPPRDAVSCLLSYLYTLLVKDVTTACYALGLDPFFGFYHQPRYGRPALALDLAEEFRPLIADSTALALINNRQADTAMFHVHPTAVVLSPTGRRCVIEAYEKRLATESTHPVFHYKVTYRRALELQARIFAAYLLAEIPKYSPFVGR